MPQEEPPICFREKRNWKPCYLMAPDSGRQEQFDLDKDSEHDILVGSGQVFCRRVRTRTKVSGQPAENLIGSLGCTEGDPTPGVP